MRDKIKLLIAELDELQKEKDRESIDLAKEGLPIHAGAKIGEVRAYIDVMEKLTNLCTEELQNETNIT